MTTFQQLNAGWNAEPNAPEPTVVVGGENVTVLFRLNCFMFPQFSAVDIGRLRFTSCRRYRLGSTNDEGWYRGQCRFSHVVPWGEFYEITGDLRLARCPNDWVEVSPTERSLRHFLFYFRDETFECEAAHWYFDVIKKKSPASEGMA